MELLLDAQLRSEGIQDFITQFKFCDRKWTFDFAWPQYKLAVEVDGGHWIGGRHSKGKGFENDCVKNNEAMLRGWHVLHFTSNMVNDPELLALRTIQRYLEQQCESYVVSSNELVTKGSSSDSSISA